MTTPTDRPAFTGLEVYRDLTHHYSFLYPIGWHQFELETDEGSGVIVSPFPNSTETSFSVAARDLGFTVTEDDLPHLRAGFEAGLADYTDLTIEQQDAFAIGALLGVEATFTYRDGARTRKRWVRALYQGTTMARVIAQGADVEAYTYWEPMLTRRCVPSSSRTGGRTSPAHPGSPSSMRRPRRMSEEGRHEPFHGERNRLSHEPASRTDRDGQ